MARSSGDDASPDQLNMVGEGTVFEGTLRADSNVRVSGRIQGTLDVQGRAIVTPDGVVEGELRATDADVAGSVQGEIHVAERLMLKSTARIDGDIAAGRIQVEEGALFSGQCEIGQGVSEKVQEKIDRKETRGGSGGNAPAAGASSGSASETAASGSASASNAASGGTKPPKDAQQKKAGQKKTTPEK